jgi:CRP-like cAMP-binding protein
MEKNLFDILSKVRDEPLPLELTSKVSSKMVHSTIKKNEVILRPGEINERIYFIQRGLLRAYSLEDGVDMTAWIKAEGEFVVSIASFYPQIPSYQFIHAVEHTEAFSISHAELFDIYKNHLVFSYIGLMLTIPVLVEWDERLHALQTMDSARRFEWFVKKHAHLLERVPGVPAKYIASYLGMTPETFSKIKSKYFRLSDTAESLDKKAS